MHLPRPIIHITKSDYNGVEYTAAVEDIPLKPTREEMWVKWRETQRVNEAWRATRNDKRQHGTIPIKQIELYNELNLEK